MQQWIPEHAIHQGRGYRPDLQQWTWLLGAVRRRDVPRRHPVQRPPAEGCRSDQTATRVTLSVARDESAHLARKRRRAHGQGCTLEFQRLTEDLPPGSVAQRHLSPLPGAEYVQGRRAAQALHLFKIDLDRLRLLKVGIPPRCARALSLALAGPGGFRFRTDQPDLGVQGCNLLGQGRLLHTSNQHDHHLSIAGFIQACQELRAGRATHHARRVHQQVDCSLLLRYQPLHCAHQRQPEAGSIQGT
jgi:hypothetical protein